MTVILMLLFLSIAIVADAVIEHRKNRVRQVSKITVNDVVQTVFAGNGIAPTMADGGEEVKKKE